VRVCRKKRATRKKNLIRYPLSHGPIALRPASTRPKFLSQKQRTYPEHLPLPSKKSSARENISATTLSCSNPPEMRKIQTVPTSILKAGFNLL
jgi:hypothetical protein